MTSNLKHSLFLDKFEAMDSKRLKQTTKLLEKAFSTWDFKKAIEASNDEATTRDFLIHPFFELLGYKRIDDFTHEYIADVGGKRGRRVDVAITLGMGNPQIIVECKRAGASFSDNHFRQLNEYIHYTPSSDIGILTNGTTYNFYLRPKGSATGLNADPFFKFNLEDYDRSDLETLALFYRPTIDLKAIVAEAEDILFLNRFDNALVEVFKTKSDGFIKDICYQMGAQRVSPQLKEQVADLVNSMSLKAAAETLYQAESDSRSSGIITTDEELKAYNIIRTILAMSSKIKDDQMSRIGYRDYKGFFSILVDDNQLKRVAVLNLSPSKKSISIDGLEHDLESVSPVVLKKFKNQLIDAALKCMG